MTELVFILDRSGSMSGLEQDTIGGFNAMMEKQRREDEKTLVTTVLFDTHNEIIHDRLPLDQVPPLTDREYYPRGCTALLDAVGSTIRHIAHIHKYASPEARPQKTLFVITTDGMENSSREYTYEWVKQLIAHEQEKYGWEFLFLGANIDAAAEGAKFGIREDRTATYKCDSVGTSLNFDVIGDAVCQMRSKKELPSNWRERIDEDVKKRGK